MADKIFNDVKLSVKWKTNDSEVRPDIEGVKDAQGYCNENLATTLGKVARYLKDYDAFESHGHALTDANITGTLPVGKGGTGATIFTSGNVLIGNGTSAVSTKAIDTTVTDSSTNLVTSGAVYTAIEALGKVFNIKSVGQYTSVSQLPTTGKQGDVHLIRVDTAPDTDNDSFEEYVWVQETGSDTGQWEFFGRLNVAGVNDASTSTKGVTYLKNAASDITSSTSSDVGSTPYAATPYAVKSFVEGKGYITGVPYWTNEPAAPGSGYPGESNYVARGDHIHPLQTTATTQDQNTNDTTIATTAFVHRDALCTNDIIEINCVPNT